MVMSTASSHVVGPPTGSVAEPDDPADRRRVSQDLLARAANCDPKTRQALLDQVVRINMSVARSVANRYRNRGVSSEDLFQVAYLGLVKAAQRFDPGFEQDFLAYATPTISGEIKRHFRDCGWTVRPPRWVQELQPRIACIQPALAQELRRHPDHQDIASSLGVSVSEVTEALAAGGCFQPVSLDSPDTVDAHQTLGSLIGCDDPEFRRSEIVQALRPLIGRLPHRDRRIIALRFFHGWTQAEIARDIGVTQMQVSRLLSSVLRRLRDQLSRELV
jgi:RNA polymerase sigma-B factor